MKLIFNQSFQNLVFQFYHLIIEELYNRIKYVVREMKGSENVSTSQIKRELNIYSRQLKSSDNFRVNFIDYNPIPLKTLKFISKPTQKNINRNLHASKNLIQEEKKKQATVQDFFNKVQLVKHKQDEIRLKKQTQNNFYHKLYRTLEEKLKKTKNHATQEVKQQIKLMDKCRNNKHMRKNSLSCSLEKYFSGSANNARDFSKMRVLRNKKSQTMKNCCLQLSQAMLLQGSNSFDKQLNTNKEKDRANLNSACNKSQRPTNKKNPNYFSYSRLRKNDTKILNQKYFQTQKQFRAKVIDLMEECQKQNNQDTEFRKNLDTFNFFCKKVDKRLEDVGNIFMKNCINL